jgi:hypothetical protein
LKRFDRMHNREAAYPLIDVNDNLTHLLNLHEGD